VRASLQLLLNAKTRAESQVASRECESDDSTAQHSQHEQANRQARQPASTASATYHRRHGRVHSRACSREGCDCDAIVIRRQSKAAIRSITSDASSISQSDTSMPMPMPIPTSTPNSAPVSHTGIAMEVDSGRAVAVVRL
jgi:hypothetical protein